MNRYRLGREFEPPFETIRACRVERERLGLDTPREYFDWWNVRDRNLGDRPEEVLQRLCAAYGEDGRDIYLPPGKFFITDDVDLFTEMYRILEVDFVADFKSGLFFCCLFGHHEAIMDQLQAIHSGRVKPNMTPVEDYVKTGLGIYRSTCSPRIYIGPDTPIPDYLRPFKHRLERFE